MIELIGLIMVIGFLLLIYMLREAFLNNIKYEEICFEDYPEAAGPLTIFFISDIHRRKISDRIISGIDGKADIVVIGGDLTEKGVSFKRVEENILKLKGLGPVYFIWGNNDYEVEERTFRNLLESNGVILIENTSLLLEGSGSHPVALIGVEDLSLGRDDIEKAFDGVPEKSFRILLAHNPDTIKKLRKEHKVSLMLSGHTHGGQIRILGFGMYQKGNLSIIAGTFVLVSNGYGTTALPLRLGAPPETHLITIKGT
ncbi:metallophosphoesterase [Bacillus salacetis]|uniref:Metallophosphoesterase n=1 Tax=Bacillus salacetis TaxID=2315464 RepID=A0A3A1QMN2_9BACI|nr:metallophosphoesterase [Bacillus salacetis]RIW28010.1 metallophosphoesterase [Bacillus salacetis]